MFWILGNFLICISHYFYEIIFETQTFFYAFWLSLAVVYVSQVFHDFGFCTHLQHCLQRRLSLQSSCTLSVGPVHHKWVTELPPMFLASSKAATNFQNWMANFPKMQDWVFNFSENRFFNTDTRLKQKSSVYVNFRFKFKPYKKYRR